MQVRPVAAHPFLSGRPESRGAIRRMSRIALRFIRAMGNTDRDRAMPFIPHTEHDVREMLAAIGAKDIDTLFDEIPAELRSRGLEVMPEALTEQGIGRLMSERAARDGQPLCFIGAGAYEHHIPAAVWEITTRGEFYRPTRRIRPRPARARCNCCTNIRP